MIIERGKVLGVEKFLLYSEYIEEAKLCLKMSEDSKLSHITVGLSPSRALDPFKAQGNKNLSEKLLLSGYSLHGKPALEKYFAQLDQLIVSAPKGKIVAIGNCGLDYTRLDYA